jgi:actin-like ATPase involved in cell morphogenesis/Tfp pilus assembly protein PilF
MCVIGIDFGTTNSRVAVLEGDIPRVIEDSGRNATPSFVALVGDGNWLVGQSAKRQAVTNPERTFFAVKRLIGCRYDDPIVEKIKKCVPYKIVRASNGDAWLDADGKTYTPSRISAFILRRIKKTAEADLRHKVTNAVITVPAYFNDVQRQAIKDAGKVAGLKEPLIISEPVAAALAYCLDECSSATIAVYHIGSSTFDVSILETVGGVFKVKSTNYDAFLGGDDFDMRLVNYLADEFQSEQGINLHRDSLALQRLKEAAEAAKIELSWATHTTINLPHVASHASGPKHLTFTLTRPRFEALVHDLLQKTVDLCGIALKDAGLTAGKIDEVVLVGGMTRMPKILEIVQRVFGKEPLRAIHPEEVLALGAAIKADMSQSGDEDVPRQDVNDIKYLLSERRFEEAYRQAVALTRAEPGNGEGWWHLTFAAKELERWEVAQSAAKEAIKLLPRNPAIWATYGGILESQGKNTEAHKAFDMSVKIAPGYGYGHLSLLLLCHKIKDYDAVISHGRTLEKLGPVNAIALDKIAIAYWNKDDFEGALDYFKRSAAREPAAFRYESLGLCYERPELARYLDAYDAYRRAWLMDPSSSRHERSRQTSARLSEKLTASAHAVRQSGGTQILDKTEFYRFYINPFVLLGCDVHADLEDYPVKTVQKLKKALIQEIELEEGRVEALEGYVIDKSRALSLCDDLLDDEKSEYHWTIFQDKRLCDFLHRGDIALFSNYFPINTLNALDSLSFLSWLSGSFSQQYNIVLSCVLEGENVAAIQAMLGGRRYVTSKDEDICFSGAGRFLDRCVESVRNAEKEANHKKPSLASLSAMAVGPNCSHALAPLLNLFRTHLQKYSNEAARLLRSIAVDCNNRHSDPHLARDILTLAKAFTFVDSDVKARVEEDSQQVAEIICKNEVHFTLSGEQIKITKDGVRKGSKFIATKEIKGVRWGATATKDRLAYEMYLSVLSDQGAEIVVSWSQAYRSSGDTSINIYNADSVFLGIINAMFRYALPAIMTKIDVELDNDRSFAVGGCQLHRSHVVIPVEGWFGTKYHHVPWVRVKTEIENGEVAIFDRLNSKARIVMSMRATYNVPVIDLIATTRGGER